MIDAHALAIVPYQSTPLPTMLGPRMDAVLTLVNQFRLCVSFVLWRDTDALV